MAFNTSYRLYHNVNLSLRAEETRTYKVVNILYCALTGIGKEIQDSGFEWQILDMEGEFSECKL